MNRGQKIIGIAILIGLPLLLLISAPSSKKSINTKSAADTTSTQSSSGLTSPDTPSSPNSSTTDATKTGQVATQAQTPSQQYNYTPTTPAPKPSNTPTAAPTSAPSAWTNTAGFLSGTYHYVVTYVPTTGQETGGSPASLGVSPNNQRVWVKDIPTSPDNGISERNLYRTLAGSSTVGPYYLVTSFYDNSTTYYYDNIPDNVLSSESPKYF